MWSPKSCGEPRIIFYVSCDRDCVDRAALFRISMPEGSVRLPIRYQGQSGFLNFIKEFRAGSSRNFGVDDFVRSALPEEQQRVTEALNRLRIRTIKVRFNVEVPSSVDKLLSLPSPVVPLAITQ
jgi:hypothetical protein